VAGTGEEALGLAEVVLEVDHEQRGARGVDLELGQRRHRLLLGRGISRSYPVSNAAAR
jgi:hypothetical protein